MWSQIPEYQNTRSMGRTSLLVLTILSVLTLSCEQNENATLIPNTLDNSQHYLVKWKAWQCLSCVGFFGTFMNLFLLYTFYSERRVLATSVNTMDCMDTLYRLSYATIGVHWRTCNMVNRISVIKLNKF